MAKCKTCGAPVNLAPDGDPKYEAPRPIPMTDLTPAEAADLVKEARRAASAVYLAAHADVAAGLSQVILGLAAHIESQDATIARLQKDRRHYAWQVEEGLFALHADKARAEKAEAALATLKGRCAKVADDYERVALNTRAVKRDAGMEADEHFWDGSVDAASEIAKSIRALPDQGAEPPESAGKEAARG